MKQEPIDPENCRILISVDFVHGDTHQMMWDTVDMNLAKDSFLTVLKRWADEIQKTHPRDDPIVGEVNLMPNPFAPSLEHITIRGFLKPAEPKHQFPVT